MMLWSAYLLVLLLYGTAVSRKNLTSIHNSNFFFAIGQDDNILECKRNSLLIMDLNQIFTNIPAEIWSFKWSSNTKWPASVNTKVINLH